MLNLPKNLDNEYVVYEDDFGGTITISIDSFNARFEDAKTYEEFKNHKNAVGAWQIYIDYWMEKRYFI